MDVAQIIQLARKRTKVTDTMISDNDMVEYFNLYYKKLHAKVIDVDWNYFWNTWTANIVADQVEYTLLQSDSITQVFGQFKIEKIGIKFDDGATVYTNAELRDWDNYDVDSSVLAEWGWWGLWWTWWLWWDSRVSQFHPIAIITDKSIVIYPKPPVDVVWWLKMEGSRKWYTLDIASTQDEILIPDWYEDIISLGIASECYRERNLLNEKNDALSEYQLRTTEMQRDITTRKTTPTRQMVNYLWYLE